MNEIQEVESEAYLEELPAKIVENILYELSKNGAWQRVNEAFGKLQGEKIISDEDELNRNYPPERQLFDYFTETCLITVEQLQNILENCELYDTLRIINTNVPAKILSPTKDSSHEVPLEGKVTLGVEVCGSPFPYIQWHLNGTPLIGKTSPQLILEKFSAKDAGDYTCRIRQRLNGSVTEVTSHTYTFTVQETPPRLTADLTDVQIKPQEDLVLKCEVTGHPEPKCFQWFKKDNKLVSQTELPHLRIRSADVHNSGEYYCIISNTAGYCTSRIATVKVEMPVICPTEPVIIEQPRANPVYLADDWLYLRCRVVCKGDVKFTCFLNDKELKDYRCNAQVITSKSPSRRHHHQCEVKFHITQEQMEKENWTQLHFKFYIKALDVDQVLLSDDVRVNVIPRQVSKPLFARNKWALVIGNTNYRNIPKLPASVQDINIMTSRFVELGFRVMKLSDLKRTAMQNGVRLFAELIQPGDYVSFFYAGHGIHNDGIDYVFPVDLSMKYVTLSHNVEKVESDVSVAECISCIWITNILQRGGPALKFSIIDTCRSLKPKFDGYEPPSTQDAYQIAAKNSFTIFATSENYEAFEDKEDKPISLLVDTLQKIMTRKIPVMELGIKLLQEFQFPEEDEEKVEQVPKISGDLSLPRSLADPSHPHPSDLEESGVLQKWEIMGSGREKMQDSIMIDDTRVEASLQWKIPPRHNGITWVITNALGLEVTLTRQQQQQQQQHQRQSTSYMQEINVLIKLSTGTESIGRSQEVKLRGGLSVLFHVPHLEELEDCVVVDLFLTYKGQSYKKRMLLKSPEFSRLFYKGNYIE